MKLKAKISDILGIQASTLRLLSIEEGCVVVKLLIPTSVAHYLFPEDRKFSAQQEEEFQDLSTQWLKCCSFYLNFKAPKAKNIKATQISIQGNNI